jgi:transposase
MAKRRRFTPEFKARVVLDILTGVQSQAEACRKHGLGPNLVALWKTALLERAHLVFDSEATRSADEVRPQNQTTRPTEQTLQPIPVIVAC